MEWQSEGFRVAMGRSGDSGFFRHWMFTREIVITNSMPLYLKPFKELSPPFYLPNFTIYSEARVGQTRHLLNCKKYLHSAGLNLE